MVLAISSQLFSCGYVLHPDRRGQTSGKVDYAIVGLDAIGLLFFVVPGLIALGVDIVSGTIYLPNSSKGLSSLDFNDAQKIQIDPKNISKESIAAAVKAKTGIDIDLNDPRVVIIANNSEVK